MASTDAFAGAKVKQEADQRGDEAGERFDRFEAQKINHHPKGNRSENDRRPRIKPNAVRPRNIRSRRAQDNHSDDCEERAKQKRELNVNDDQLETARQQK